MLRREPVDVDSENGDPGGSAAEDSSIPEDCGFESGCGYGYLPLVSVVFCVTDRSFVQRSAMEREDFVCVCVCVHGYDQVRQYPFTANMSRQKEVRIRKKGLRIINNFYDTSVKCRFLTPERFVHVAATVICRLKACGLYGTGETTSTCTNVLIYKFGVLGTNWSQNCDLAQKW
jgi:hypothetical protein